MTDTRTDKPPCLICGGEVPKGRRFICGDPKCKKQRMAQLYHRWRSVAPVNIPEPPPRPLPVQKSCRVCGAPVGYHKTTLCGDPECKRIRDSQNWRNWHWRTTHGIEPPPLVKVRPCRICGKPLHVEHKPKQLYCAGFCNKLARAADGRRFYERHRDEVLARQAEYRAKKAEAAR